MRYIKKFIGQILLVILAIVGVFAWLIGSDYPMYQELSKNGIETYGAIIDYREHISRRKSRERIVHLYTLAIDREHIRRISISEPRYQIGSQVRVLYSPQGKGCLVGTSLGSPFELAKYGFLNGRCFKVREDLDLSYKASLRSPNNSVQINADQR